MDNLYYRRRRGRKRGFFTPFLIILCIIVIVVLAVQIIASLKAQSTETKKNQAFAFVERGDAEFQAWGQETWHEAYNKALILEGDRLRTSDDAYSVIEFYDGSRLRMNEGTEVLFEKFEAGKKSIDVEVRLYSGEIWINELSTSDNLKFRVFTPNLNISAVGTRYGVSVDEDEFVRVIDGEVKVIVANTLLDDHEALESVSIGIGQQISLNQSDIDDLEARKFVNLLESIDDYWRVTEWHLWNIREDESPTKYRTHEETPKEAQNERDDVVGVFDVNGDLVEEEGDISEEAKEIEVPVPKITFTNPPTSPFELKDKRIYLKGEVSADVTKVIMTEFYEDPDGVPYELSKFVPGSGVWNYAAGLDFGNLKKGKNRFVVQAFNSDGLVSDPVEIIVNIADDIENTEDVVVDEVVDSVESIEEVEVVLEESTSVVIPVAFDEPAIESKPIAQTQPFIGSFDAAEKIEDNYFVTTEGRVVINGFTGATDVEKVIVNGWPLSLYEPGSSEWSYYAKSSIGTLKRGVNVYNVYTENAAGERSLSLTFTIEKK